MLLRVRCFLDGIMSIVPGKGEYAEALAVHAMKLYFQEKTLIVARDRLLSSVNLRTITWI